MSQENVEIVRLAYAAFNGADRDALTELTDSNWVFDFSRSIGPDEGSLPGSRASPSICSHLRGGVREFQLSPIEYVVGPGGEIVVRHQVSAKGRGSGVEWERVPDAALVWELRDDKVIKTTLYQHHAEALEAAGLRE